MNRWANRSGLSMNVSAFVRAIMYSQNQTSRNPTVPFVSVPYLLQLLHTVAAFSYHGRTLDVLVALRLVGSEEVYAEIVRSLNDMYASTSMLYIQSCGPYSTCHQKIIAFNHRY